MANMMIAVVVSVSAHAAVGQITCAAPGETFCAADMAVINTTLFDGLISNAALMVFQQQVPSKVALACKLDEAGVNLSADCLACQAAGMDCGMAQTACLSKCMANFCGNECRECARAACHVASACGGIPGVSVQAALACTTANDPTTLAYSASIDAIAADPSCTATVSANSSSAATCTVTPTPPPTPMTATTGNATATSVATASSVAPPQVSVSLWHVTSAFALLLLSMSKN